MPNPSHRNMFEKHFQYYFASLYSIKTTKGRKEGIKHATRFRKQKSYVVTAQLTQGNQYVQNNKIIHEIVVIDFVLSKIR